MRKPLLLLLVVIATVVIGQNCSKFANSNTGSTDLSALTANADIAWSIWSNPPEVNTYGRITRWRDSGNRGVNLYPPFRPSSTVFNFDKAPIYQPNADPNYVRFEEGVTLSPAVADLVELTGDRFTIAIVIKDLRFPSADPKAIRIFNFQPSTGENLGHLALDVAADGKGGANIGVVQWFGAENYSYQSILLNAAELSQPLAFAVRFDKDPDKLQIAVNGRLASGNAQVKGAPPQLGYVARSLSLHSPEGGYLYLGQFSMSDFVMFKSSALDQDLKAMSAAFYARAMGRGITGPITIGDSNNTPSPETSSEGAQLYNTHCASCHGSLVASAKRGATLARLNLGITSVAQMASLVSLSNADRQKIVDALK